MESEVVLIATLALIGVIWIWVNRHSPYESPLKWPTLILGLVFLLTASTVAAIVLSEVMFK